MINTNQVHKELSNSNMKITRLCHKLLDDNFLDANGRIKEELKFKINNPTLKIQNSKFIGKPEDKFETMLFLPEGEGRQGEGGLRTRGYFKHSYKLVDGKWFIVDSDNNPVIPAPEDIQFKIKQYLTSTDQHQTPVTEFPLITVITVVYNGAKYLEETILSVINQTYPNVAYIIIDGGSTDGTLDIIKKYEDYIDYWVSEKDKGIYDAMNKGVDLATGQWINFMNAGDSFYSKQTLLDVSTQLDKKYAVIAGYVNYIFSKNRQKIKFLKNKLGPFNIRFSHHQSSFIHVDLIKKYKYNDKFKIRGDTDLFAKIYTNGGNWHKISDVIANYNINGVSSSISFRNFIEEIHIGKQYLKFFPLQHILYYVFYVIPRFLIRKILPSKIVNILRVWFSR